MPWLGAILGLVGSLAGAGIGAASSSDSSSKMAAASRDAASRASESAKLQLAYEMMQRYGLGKELDPIMRMWASTLGLEPDALARSGAVKSWKSTGKGGKLYPDWITGELSPYMNEAFAKQRQTAWEEPIHQLGKLQEATLQGLGNRGINAQSPLAQSLMGQAREAQWQAGRQGQQGVDMAKLQAQENEQNKGREQYYQNLWNLPQLMIQKRGFGSGQMAQGFQNLFNASAMPRPSGGSSGWGTMGTYLGGLLSDAGKGTGWMAGWGSLDPKIIDDPSKYHYDDIPWGGGW